MNRVADMRNIPATLVETTALFSRLAEAVAQLAYMDARADRRLAKLKTEHQTETADLRGFISAVEKDLVAAILAHRAWFEDPRKIKTQLGSFGLQTVSELEVDDPEALVAWLGKHGFEEAVKRVQTPIKPAVQKLIEEGTKIPGARINSGDTAVYKVAAPFLAAAKRKAESD